MCYLLDVAWTIPDTAERVAQQMERAVFRDGVWYRLEDGKRVVWPVLAAQTITRAMDDSWPLHEVSVTRDTRWKKTA